MTGPEERPALAVVSAGRLRHDLRDPLMSGFLDGVEPVNRWAEEAPGFVRRCHGEAGHSGLLDVLGTTDVLVNVSVWRDYPSFHRFTYQGLHGRYLSERERWFLPLPGPTTALWWVAPGARPDADTGLARLRVLRREGPTPRAFTVLRRFASDGTPERRGRRLS